MLLGQGLQVAQLECGLPGALKLSFFRSSPGQRIESAEVQQEQEPRQLSAQVVPVQEAASVPKLHEWCFQVALPGSVRSGGLEFQLCRSQPG